MKLVDCKSYELAEHFCGSDEGWTDEDRKELAEVIQAAIEDWMTAHSPGPWRPMLDEAVLVRNAPGRALEGEIRPGDVFAWEPDLPHARGLVVVSRLTGKEGVYTRPLNGGPVVWNDISRFREACVRTIFKPMPPEATS